MSALETQDNNMDKYSIHTIIILAMLLTGCGGTFNPCYPSPLSVGLTPEQTDACNQCNDHNGCEAASETGDDEIADWLTCETGQSEGTDFVPTLCYVGHRADLGPTPFGQPVGPTGWVLRDPVTCFELTEPFPCDRNWQGGGHEVCVMCEASVDLPDPGSRGYLSLGTGEWQMCPGWSEMPWSPASVLVEGFVGPSWLQNLICQTGEPVGPQTCDPVRFSAAANQPFVWTCACPSGSDDECMPGTVCEAGWIMDDGFIPHPTLCTWDDGTGNGAAPEGPPAYGLVRWEDGLTFNGGTITITPEFAVAAFGGGLLNDDQRIAPDGEVLSCGRSALCSHLGIEAGDVVSADPQALDDFVTRGTAFTVWVYKPDTVVTWTVSL
jgi:hypothetical protein